MTGLLAFNNTTTYFPTCQLKIDHISFYFAITSIFSQNMIKCAIWLQNMTFFQINLLFFCSGTVHKAISQFGINTLYWQNVQSTRNWGKKSNLKHHEKEYPQAVNAMLNMVEHLLLNKRGFPTTFGDSCVQYILLQESKVVKEINILTSQEKIIRWICLIYVMVSRGKMNLCQMANQV